MEDLTIPWSTPVLKQVREFTRDNIRSSLPGADALVPNSVLRVLSDAMSALCHLTLQYLDWLALQLLPDTAETEWLDRHAHIWLTSADGSTGRKLATLASGTVTMTGTIPWTRIPTGTRLAYQAINYETTNEIYLSQSGAPTAVAILALDPGTGGNVPPDTKISVINPVPGLDGVATVVKLTGGVDEETDDQLRYRVLLRIREPPMGGAKVDYEEWALAVPGVTRAWTGPLEMGPGTVTVRFMCDDLRAARQGFPQDEDLLTVRDYLDKVRPVAVKDLFVLAPIPQRVNMIIRRLIPDTPAVRAGIEDSLKRMLRERAAPGQTIFAAWKTCAILDAPGVVSFDTDNDNDFMTSPGHMAILGDVIYGEPGSTRLAATEETSSASHALAYASDSNISAHLHE